MYFCSRFRKEIFEALYLRLAIGNVRSSSISEIGMMVRVYSVDFISHLLIKVFSQPPIEEVVYGTTLLF